MSVGIEGLYRDVDELVVDRNHHNFGDRCIWTNEPHQGNVATLEFQAPGVLSTKLEVPVSPSWKGAAVEAKKHIGRIVFRIGAALLLLGMISYAVVLSFGKIDDPQYQMMTAVIFVIPFSVGVIAVIAGLMWPYLEGTPGSGGVIFSPRISDRFLSIRGVHPDFLAELPQVEVSTAAKSTPSPYVGYRNLALGSAVALAGVVATLIGSYQLMEARSSLHWPKTEGEVVSAVVKQSQSLRRRSIRTNYSPQIDYTFEVKGQRYTSNRLGLGTKSFASEADATNFLSRYPVGSPVSVTYQPNNPGKSVLEPGPTWEEYFWPPMGLVVLTSGCILIWVGLRGIKQGQTLPKSVASTSL